MTWKLTVAYTRVCTHRNGNKVTILKRAILDEKKREIKQMLLGSSKCSISRKPTIIITSRFQSENVTIEDENIVLVQMNKSTRTRAESQQIVTQGYSHAYNTLFNIKSSTKDFHFPRHQLVMKI